MKCEQYEHDLTAAVDGQLSQEGRRRLDDHLLDCPACTRKLKDFLAIKEQFTMIEFKEPSDKELDRYWSRVYNRLERGVSWILFSLGLILVTCWAIFMWIEVVFEDPDISIWFKAGVVMLIVGLVALIVSALRERLTLRKTDKYSQEVER